MGNDIAERMRSAAERAARVVAGIRDEQLGAATPCAEYDVRALLNHLYQVAVNFQAMAAREPVDWSETPDRTADGGLWREGFAAEAERMAEAWSAPDALDGVSPGMGLPQTTVARMGLTDLTVHAWDLAAATGQEFTPDAEAVDEVAAFMDEMGDMGRKMGSFGQAVEVGADAPPFVRLLAASGRNPAWGGHSNG